MKQRKPIRKSYKSQMTEDQEGILKRYFTEKSQKPSHQEKKKLSEKSGVDPFLMNKWFQRERNRMKKKAKEESLSSSSSTLIRNKLKIKMNTRGLVDIQQEQS